MVPRCVIYASGKLMVPFVKENTGCETNFEWSCDERFGVGCAQVWQLSCANVLELGKEVWVGYKFGCPGRREARGMGGKLRNVYHRRQESSGFLKEAANSFILMRQKKSDPGLDTCSFC